MISIPSQPWMSVLLRFRPDALRRFLGAFHDREDFFEHYVAQNFDDDERMRAFEALMAGLAHCANEKRSPLRELRGEAAHDRAQSQRTANRYKPQAGVDVHKQKSFSVREINKARAHLLYGYALHIGKPPRSIDTWRPMTELISLVASLRRADPVSTPLERQRKDENVYGSIRSTMNNHIKTKEDETAASAAFSKVYATLHSAG